MNTKVLRTKTWKRRRDLHTKIYENPFFQPKLSIFDSVTFKIFNILLLIFICFGLYYFLFLSKNFSIKGIEVYGVDIVITEKIRGTIIEQLNKNRFIIFPQDNIFAFNKKEALSNIAKFLSYQTISIDIKGRRLMIIIEEDVGAIKFTNKNGSFLLNNNGLVLRSFNDYNPMIENFKTESNFFYLSLMIENDQRPLLYDFSNMEVGIGKTILPKEFISKILFLEKVLKENIDLKVSSYQFNNIASNHIQINTSEGWKILVNLDNEKNIKANILRLNVILKQKFKDDRSRLKYIDLRNGEKIFYQ